LIVALNPKTIFFVSGWQLALLNFKETLEGEGFLGRTFPSETFKILGLAACPPEFL